MVKLMHPVNNSSFLSQVLSVSRSAILPSPLNITRRGEQGKATQENAAIERKTTKKKKTQMSNCSGSVKVHFIIARQRRCGCGDASDRDYVDGGGGDGVCHCCPHRHLLGCDFRLLPRTRSGGFPRRPFGTLWSSTWCVGSAGIWRIAVYILPTCRIARTRIVGCHLGNRPCGIGCALPRRPSKTCRPVGATWDL